MSFFLPVMSHSWCKKILETKGNYTVSIRELGHGRIANLVPLEQPPRSRRICFGCFPSQSHQPIEGDPGFPGKSGQSVSPDSEAAALLRRARRRAVRI